MYECVRKLIRMKVYYKLCCNATAHWHTLQTSQSILLTIDLFIFSFNHLLYSFPLLFLTVLQYTDLIC